MNPINASNYLFGSLPDFLQWDSLNNSTIFQSNVGVTPPGSPKNNLSFEPARSNFGAIAFPQTTPLVDPLPSLLIPPPPVQHMNGMKLRRQVCAICHETKLSNYWGKIKNSEDLKARQCTTCYNRAREEMKQTCAICKETKLCKRWYRIKGLGGPAARKCSSCYNRSWRGVKQTCGICHKTKILKLWYKIQDSGDLRARQCSVCYNKAR